MSNAAVLSGLATSLACVLLIAGIAKMRRENAFVVHLGNLLPDRLWRGRIKPRGVARTVWLVEIITGLSILTAAQHPQVAWAAWICLMFAVFFVATIAASRRRVSCGCFGDSLSPASIGTSLWRSTWLAGGALATVVLSASEPTPAELHDVPQAGLSGAGFLLIAFAPSWIRAVRNLRPAIRAPRDHGDDVGLETGATRRVFVTRALAACAAVLGYTAMAQSASAVVPPPTDCKTWLIDCNVCCGMNPSCAACCSACYYNCRLFGGCIVNCNGCW